MSHRINTKNCQWFSNSDASGKIIIKTEKDSNKTFEEMTTVDFEDIEQYLNYCGYEIKETSK